MSEIKFEKLLTGLSVERPVFHSEADFQHALAWEIRKRYGSEYKVRLEYTTYEQGTRISVDIWLLRDNQKPIAIELKYKKKKFERNVSGDGENSITDEKFFFTSSGARDGGCFDFLNDVRRIESLKRDGLIEYGVSIFLTNENLYWKKGSDRNTKFYQFSLDDDRIIPNSPSIMSFRDDTGAGYKGDRDHSIELIHSYKISWEWYSEKFGFKWMMVKIVN